MSREFSTMDLTSKKIIKNLLKRYGIRPSKALGQNFLVSKGVLEKILKTADLSPEDVVLEIGPGIGTLTKELAKKAKQVIAIEKDKKMIEILKETLEDFKNVEIINGDILKTNLEDYKLQTINYKLISNLPYYITSPVIRKFLEATIQPKEMVLMLQKEVGQRICAKPPKMNLLAISVQFYSKPEIISFVPKTCFWPKPKVDSAIIKIVPRKFALLSASIRGRFFGIVRAGFSQPRKQLVNSLASGLKLDKTKTQYWLETSGISFQRRPQTLTIKDWIKLTKTFTINQ